MSGTVVGVMTSGAGRALPELTLGHEGGGDLGDGDAVRRRWWRRRRVELGDPPGHEDRVTDGRHGDGGGAGEDEDPRRRRRAADVGVVCWIQKPGLLPIVRTAVTIPGRARRLPRARGEEPAALDVLDRLRSRAGRRGRSVSRRSRRGGVTVTGGAFGVGAPTVKSAALLPVLDAVALRWADVEFVGAGAGPDQRSRCRAVAHEVHDVGRRVAVACRTRGWGRAVLHERHLASRRAHGMDPLTSGVGRGVVRPWPPLPPGPGRRHLAGSSR